MVWNHSGNKIHPLMLQSDTDAAEVPGTSCERVEGRPRPRLTIGTPVSNDFTAPKISVLIPTYNYARYLPEAIESVLAQDFPDYELVIVDDCSEDDSGAVLRRYSESNSRIRVQINRSNLGMVANWNYCLSLARGEYIQFLFGDDKLADRQTLSKMASLLDNNPAAVMAVAARNIIDGDSKIVEVCDQLGAAGFHRGWEVITRCFEMNANIIGEPSVVMFRHELALRGFNHRYHQLTDLEMWFHLLEKGDAVYTPEPLYCFRRHGRQQTVLNQASRVGEREALLLLSEYHLRPWFMNHKRRRMLFTQIYSLRRHGGFGEDTRELESRLLESLGQAWYNWFWMLRKLGRPFQNLKRFYNKHLLHRAV